MYCLKQCILILDEYFGYENRFKILQKWNEGTNKRRKKELVHLAHANMSTHWHCIWFHNKKIYIPLILISKTFQTTTKTVYSFIYPCIRHCICIYIHRNVKSTHVFTKSTHHHCTSPFPHFVVLVINVHLTSRFFAFLLCVSIARPPPSRPSVACPRSAPLGTLPWEEATDQGGDGRRRSLDRWCQWLEARANATK